MAKDKINKKKTKKEKEIKTVTNVEIDIVCVNEENNCDNDKESSLNFSQRKDRFLIVTTVIGVLIVVSKYFMQIAKEIFETIYLHNPNILGIDNIFFSVEQIGSTLYISAIIHVIGVFLIYCFFELQNLKSIKPDIKMNNAADKWYESVFKIAVGLFLSNGLVSLLILYGFSDKGMPFYVTLIIVVVIIGTLGWMVIKKKDQRLNSAVKLIVGHMGLNAILSFFLFLVLFVMVNERHGTMVANYNQENIVLEFYSTNYPEEIKCNVWGEGSILDDTFLFEECGEYAWIEKISATEKGKDDNINIGENYYYYRYTLDIDDMHKDGAYTIEIVYQINNTEYRMVNMFIYDGEYSYTQSQMEITL